MAEELKLSDVGAEGLLIGCILQDNLMLLDLYDKLYPHETYFANDATLFFYKLLQELYFVKKHERIDETKINIYMEQNPEEKAKYKQYGGWQTLKRLRDKADLHERDMYYDTILKYATIRRLHEKGFSIEPVMNVIDDIEPDQIIQTYEFMLNDVQMKINGIAEDIILGQNIKQRVQQWRTAPDIGIEIPFPIINSLIRGARKKKLNMIGMHSGRGKSRVMARVHTYMSIENDEPTTILVNEQDEEEWDGMILSSVINNILLKGKNKIIDEVKILTNTCSEEENKWVDEAAHLIEERSKIHFQVLKKWDYNTIERILKRNKYKGASIWTLDTFKPFRGKINKGNANWEMFVETARMLKELNMEYDLSGFITFQLTDDTQFETILNSTSIANGKHIKHEADSIQLWRELTDKEIEEGWFMPVGKLDLFGSPEKVPLSAVPLTENDTIYINFVDKNRGGRDKDVIAYKVNKGANVWVELGYYVRK